MCLFTWAEESQLIRKRPGSSWNVPFFQSFFSQYKRLLMFHVSTWSRNSLRSPHVAYGQQEGGINSVKISFTVILPVLFFRLTLLWKISVVTCTWTAGCSDSPGWWDQGSEEVMLRKKLPWPSSCSSNVSHQSPGWLWLAPQTRRFLWMNHFEYRMQTDLFQLLSSLIRPD